MPTSTTATRAARYEERMRAAGFVKKHVWVPEEQAGRLQEIAAEMRERYRPDRVKTLDEALRRLRASRAELEREGVRHVAIFGSFARGDDRPDSDIDILVSLDPDIDFRLSAFMELQRVLEAVIGRPVDMVDSAALKERFRREIEDERVHAF
jgi:predicted nucleotidyltransferase